MKLNEEIRQLETSQNIVPTNFRIKASKKAFEILSSGLYSDKVKAIIRELSTNAADAHVAAGKGDVPFTVHLPNSLEPYFSVRDEGTGLSEQQITTLYTTYFESDKIHSNDFTGCLGLGSKSPFSYTDQFTVESRYNGKKYVYNAFIDQSGVPSIAKLGESDTDEPNGLEVKFPVKAADFYEFKNKAEEVLQWFTVRPKVVGNSSFEYEETEYLRKTDKYALAKHRRYHSYVVMGNVAYAVDAYEIRNTKVELTTIERKVLEWGIDLYVPIGSVDITANREKISYDDTSVAAMKEVLAQAIEYIKAEVENQIANAATIWQARRALHDARHSIIGQVRDLMTVKWQGKDILDHVTNKTGVKDGDTPPTIQSVDRRQTNFKKHFVDSIFADGRPIIVNDLGHGGYARVIQYLNDKSLDHAYLVNAVNNDWLVATGIKEVALYTSTMPKPQRNKTYVPRRSGSRAKVNELVVNGSGRQCADYWKPAEVEMEDGGVYVEIIYYRYKRNGDKEDTRHPSDLQQIHNLLKIVGAETPIYGIRTSDLESVKKHELWVSLKDYITSILEEHYDEFKDKIAALKDWHSCGSQHNNISCFYSQRFFKGSKYGAFIARLRKAHEAAQDNKVRTFVSLANEVGFEIPEVKGNLNELHAEVRATYPLLHYLNWWNVNYHRGEGVKAVMEYINAIDMQHGCEELEDEPAPFVDAEEEEAA